MNLVIVWVGGKFENKYSIMKDTISILIITACAYAILIHIFRIIWLCKEDINIPFFNKRKRVEKYEMLIYYLLTILALSYAIFNKWEAINF